MSDSLELPIAPIQRIMKQALPPSVNVSKEVKQSFGKAAAIFVLYLTHTANETCRAAKRSMVSAEDVLAAVEEMEFDMFLEPLQNYLKEFREEKEKNKKKPKAGGDAGASSSAAAAAAGEPNSGKKRSRPSTGKGPATSSSAAAAGEGGDAAADEEEEREGKKARLSGAEEDAADEQGMVDEDAPAEDEE